MISIGLRFIKSEASNEKIQHLADLTSAGGCSVCQLPEHFTPPHSTTESRESALPYIFWAATVSSCPRPGGNVTIWCCIPIASQTLLNNWLSSIQRSWTGSLGAVKTYSPSRPHEMSMLICFELARKCVRYGRARTHCIVTISAELCCKLRTCRF